MNIPPEVIAAIKSSFENAKCPKTVKTRPCKTVWRNKGFAKAALLNHLHERPIGAAINQYILKKNALTSTHHYSYVDSRIIKELRDELEKLGIIEYVEVDLEDFAVQRK